MRAKSAPARNNHRKKVMKAAKGFKAGRGNMYRHARAAVKRAEQQAFVSRKLKKREYRRLWITRINIGTRAHGLTYSRFIAGLNAANVDLDRKQLSELAIHQPEAFAKLVEQAKAALG